MNILAGDFGENSAIALLKNFSGQLETISIHTSLFGSPIKINPSQIASVELVTDQNKVSLLGACGWGIAGTLIAGPVGAIVGGLLGGKKQVKTILVTFDNQKRFLATCSPSEYELLISAQMIAADAAKRLTSEKRDWTFLGESQPTEESDWSFLDEQN